MQSHLDVALATYLNRTEVTTRPHQRITISCDTKTYNAVAAVASALKLSLPQAAKFLLLPAAEDMLDALHTTAATSTTDSMPLTSQLPAATDDAQRASTTTLTTDQPLNAHPTANHKEGADTV
jgi:hypothetical protein